MGTTIGVPASHERVAAVAASALDTPEIVIDLDPMPADAVIRLGD